MVVDCSNFLHSAWDSRPPKDTELLDPPSVAEPFDIKSHKIQTNKEPRDEEICIMRQWEWEIRKGVLHWKCSGKTSPDLEMRMLWNECMWCSFPFMCKKYSTDSLGYLPMKAAKGWVKMVGDALNRAVFDWTMHCDACRNTQVWSNWLEGQVIRWALPC